MANTDMSTLKGKTALVTGSTSGIGLGMAIALAKQGVNIMVNGFGENYQKKLYSLHIGAISDKKRGVLEQLYVFILLTPHHKGQTIGA